jgi:DNA-3-methyladenine glycosylase I
MAYCDYIHTMAKPSRSLHKNYHDGHYGFPIHNDDELFGRLIMEINQAGLSWETILKKEATFRLAYDNFSIQKIANYTQDDRERLLADPGIIRNKLKVNATIINAQTIIVIQKEHGSFENWLKSHHPKSKEEWVKIFKKTFKFTGGEIVNEFLMSIGYLKGAHTTGCPVYHEVAKHKPLWMQQNEIIEK